MSYPEARRPESRTDTRPVCLDDNLAAFPSAAILIGPDGRVIAWNPRADRLLEVPSDQAVGQRWDTLEPAGRLTELAPMLTGAREPGVSRTSREIPFARQDGTEIVARVTMSPVIDDVGRAAGLLVVIEELDELARDTIGTLRARLAELTVADQHKSDFLTIIAHELRNPLAPILAAMHVMRLQSSRDPVVGRARRVVERQVKHLARLLDDLLDISRIAEGKVHLLRESVDLRAVVTEAIETTEHLIQSGGHRLLVELGEHDLTVIGDHARLVQVFTNLLANAARYTQPGGEITVRGELVGNEAVMTVRDTGIGIDAEVLPRIFDLFRQADTSIARSSGGLGIGLTLVKIVVELHGGTVTASSKGLGYGSEFVVRLALATRPSDPNRGLVAAAAAAPGRRPQRILVVEDNRDARDMLRLALELEGHGVIEAADGPRAVEAARTNAADVVLVDIGLPGFDGFEVARRIRKSLGDAVFLVALTGYGDSATVQRAREAGFDVHLVKPVDPMDIVRLVAGRPASRGG